MSWGTEVLMTPGFYRMTVQEKAALQQQVKDRIERDAEVGRQLQAMDALTLDLESRVSALEQGSSSSGGQRGGARPGAGRPPSDPTAAPRSQGA